MSHPGIDRLAAAVRQRREHLRLSQADLIGRAGPSEQTVRKIEQGRDGPFRGKTLSALDHALRWKTGTSAAILNGSADPDPEQWVAQTEVAGRAAAQLGGLDARVGHVDTTPDAPTKADRDQTLRLGLDLLKQLQRRDYGDDGRAALTGLLALLHRLLIEQLEEDPARDSQEK